MSNRTKRIYKRIKKNSVRQQMRHYKRFCDLINGAGFFTRIKLAMCVMFKKL